MKIEEHSESNMKILRHNKDVFIKEESEDMKIEETFRVKHEDTETQTKMVFIKEESEDMKIEEAFRVKHEDTETQTKMCLLKRRVKTRRLKKHSESNMKILRHKQRCVY